MKNNKTLSWLLTFVRIVIGWHFLYEGAIKIFGPQWSSAAYLANSKWIFAGLFHSIAGSPAIVSIVDIINAWGLLLGGLALILGIFTRLSSICGAVLLLFYFMAYPPIPGYMFGVPTEGAYLWVNRNLIELITLVAIAFLPQQMLYGLDRWYKRWKEEKARPPIPSESGSGNTVERRAVLRDIIGVPVLGAFAYAWYRKSKWDSLEERFIAKTPDAKTGATLLQVQFKSLSELKGTLPKGKIKNMELSRLVMGGNLIGGWAHARDLIYVSSLVKAYHNDEKVIQTLGLAEKCGINAIITNPQLGRIINKYWHETRGKMQFISDCGYQMDFLEGINLSIDAGAHACYCQGEITDRWVPAGKFDELAKGLEKIRKQGLPAGLGAHKLETVKACVENGLKPDFWVKTLHHHNYWSAMPEKEWKDNMFCNSPQETIAFMNELEEPWIAFKVLAAGAIDPKDGFPFAFNNGADFICVGMYDFQIVEDTNIVLDTLKNVNRTRPWRG